MKRPLVYYVSAFFIGCFSTLTFKTNIIYGAVIAASFLIIMAATLKWRAAFICMLFFMLGMIDYNIYFNIRLNDEAKIRIEYKNGYLCIGNYKGRKILLQGNIYNLSCGEKIYAYGKAYPYCDYIRGTAAKYKIYKYTSDKKDFISKMYQYKNEAYKSFKDILGEEKSGIVMSLCFGDTSYTEKSQKLRFQKLGVIHAFSVSGLHLSLIYAVIEYVFNFKCALILSVLYILFTGANASAIRALVMITVLKVSKIVYKNYDKISSLSFAALILLVIRPYYITDIGFMLSFLSTLGILLYYTEFKKMFRCIPQKLKNSLCLTMSAQVFSLPYTACTLNNFSPGFILGNIFLVPLYSIIIVLGNISLPFINIPHIFRCLGSIMYVLMELDECISDVLLKISPSVIMTDIKMGAYILCIYMLFLLYKHGYKKCLYVPLMTFIILIPFQYKFIPDVNCFSSDSVYGIYARYKSKSVIVCSYDITQSSEILKLAEKHPADYILTNPQINTTVKISGGFMIKCIKNGYELYFHGRKYFVNVSDKKGTDEYYIITGYDIIKFGCSDIFP